jgi:hypothetical protein
MSPDCRVGLTGIYDPEGITPAAVHVPVFDERQYLLKCKNKVGKIFQTGKLDR